MARAVSLPLGATAKAEPGGLRRTIRRLSLYALLTVGAVVSVFPFFWMVMTALKRRQEALANPPTVFPHHWQWSNFADAWHAAPFARYLINSLGISAVVAVGVMITSLLAAYAFTRLQFPFRNVLFGIFLATMMIPFEATLIPNFIIVTRLHFYDTYLALTVPWLANVVGIFLMRQFFLQLPNELFEAATVDGCGHVRMLWNVVLPLAKGPLGAVALLNFLQQWNGLLWPLLVTGHENIRPVQLGLSVFVNADTNDPQLQMAAATLTILPIVIFYFFLQKQFIEGIASTGLK
jgi:multiple sugar transport system permease protein